MKAVLIALTFLVSQVCTTDYTLYMENLAEEINKIPGITWKAEVNERFKGKTLEQIKISLGARKETEATRLPEREFTARNDLPESFDLREKYPKCEALFDIRDQGACGSCWAHSAVEVISDRICINSNQRLQYRISAEHLMSCCFSCGDGCFGGWPSSSFTWYERFGICTGGNYGDKSTCKPYSFKPCNHHGFPGPYDECEEYQSTPKCTNYCNSIN